ncbi:rho guanine nucleotide exchange factor 1b isoform X2 [Trichomycterus rosablanca]|uniref:rho guanine nucleotide exchange factor 1b isoform X2 n=1 Tax=Trichomycterus rosablanca TaxID=2290929 RepID=UPI002F35C382
MDYEDAHNGHGQPGAHCPNLAKNIIGAEDEDFENELDQTVDDQCSHFNSIELLKNRPTHLLAFVHHVILQFDCAPLLCYLHADLFRNLSSKETKKQFVEFYNNFLDKGAILRVAVPSHITNELDRTRPDLISEDMQKRYVQEVQNMHTLEVLRQLEDFRQKRMMGMTPNESELTEVENHRPTERVPRDMKEKAVAERLVEKLFESNPSIVADVEKGSAIFGAVAYYMKHLGVKTRAPDSKKGRGFFRWKPAKNEEPKRMRSIFTEATRYLPSVRSNVEPKRLDTEGDKDKNSNDRKGAGSIPPHRGSTSEGGSAPFPVRKPTLPVQVTVQVTDSGDVPFINSVISSTDTSLTDLSVNSSRSDISSVSDGGDVSPASHIVGISISEPPATTDTPAEEIYEKESLDAPMFSPEVPVSSPVSGPLVQQEELEPRLVELEQDPPNWKELASSDVLSNLTKKEIKRQEVINELFITEHAHARMLSVLQTVFARPMEREGFMDANELQTLLPSLEDIIDIHYAFYENLKKLREQDGYVVKTISTPLLNRFKGSEGEWFQKLTSRFCSHQSWALVQLKSRQKKDPRFNAFILEAESKPQCRRLQLKDIIPTEMQRLTKYPLLLENIAKSTEDNKEKQNIQQAAECCRKILNHVNKEVKHMQDFWTIKEYQRKLDTSGLKPSNELYTEYKNFDLTTRSMLYEGPLTWRVTKEKALDVQGVLLGDLLVLLQKQDDKMLLKCQSKSNIAVQEGKQMLSPIIKLDSAFLREVATDRKAFYVIFTWDSGAQIYELVAQSVAERKIWTDEIKSAVDKLKKSGGHTLDRMRLGSMPASASAYRSLHPSLSPTENGSDPLKNNTGQYKDSPTDEKCRNSQPSLIDFLTANGFDPLCIPSEKSATVALEEVISLKRLLISHMPEDASPDEEREVGLEKQEHDTDESQSQEEHKTEGQEEREGENAKSEEEKKNSAPLVLSQEQMDEVSRRLHNLEDQVKQLQNLEEDYHRLQDALAKFTIHAVGYN